MSHDHDSHTGHSLPRRAILSAGAVAGVGALTGGLSGCSSDGSKKAKDKIQKKVDHPPDNLKRKGFPIVDKPIKLKFMTGKFAGNAKDYNKVAIWKKYQQLTNIEIDWGLVPFDDREEKRNLALSGDNYPDVFNTMNLSTRDVGKYGSQGILVNLKPIIDKYMPNLKKLMSDNKEVRRGMTFPDDGIYGMPYIEDPDFSALRISYKNFVRRDWLDKFDMDVPTTTDEYYRYLKAVKTKSPNGKDDAIGYCDDSDKADFIRNALMGSFGIGNRGATQGYLDVDPDDKEKVRFYRISEGYKALIEYLHKLYSEGLIAKNIFSIDDAKVASAAAKGTYGSMVDFAPSAHYGAKNFVPTPALKGPDGDRSYNLIYSSLGSVGGFVITDQCKHPLTAARWMDYFYSDAGAKLFFMGVEGKSYKKTADGVEYVDKIKKPKNGVTTDEAKTPYVTYMGGGYAGIVKQDYFKGLESSDQSIKAAKKIEPDAQKEIWPSFTFTQHESSKLDSLAEDIEKYVDESFSKFVNGDLPLSDWDKYVKKIKRMGLDDYMEIQQSAYDRYRKT